MLIEEFKESKNSFTHTKPVSLPQSPRIEIKEKFFSKVIEMHYKDRY